MKYKAHIAIDADDVVVDFVGGLREAVRKEFGVDISSEEVSEWDLHPLLDPIVGRNWWEWLREREWLWANFPAVDGAMGSLDILRREGFYLELLTSKPRWAEHNVWKWLGKWRPPFNQVTIVGRDDVKSDFSRADILIDDKIENLVGFYEDGKAGLLFDRPHNRNSDLSLLGIDRVSGWPEVVKKVRERYG